ncbi:MAG: phosphoenolpyruvate--protein phosphotransferase [Christensenellales bacterium]|jgi:phosphotransferase system enzyme I (PtsI)
MIHVKGKPGAPGFAHGKIVLMKKVVVQEASGSSADPAAEARRMREARQKCLDETGVLYEEAKERLGEEDAKIIKAYLMMLEDKALLDPIVKQIEKGVFAEAAVEAETKKLAARFETFTNEYMRQRADDIRHVGRMLINCLQGAEELVLPQEPFILAAQDLSPADTLKMNKDYLAGIVTQLGGKTSHTVILSKTMGIPAIIGVEEIFDVFPQGESAVMDGSSGDIYIAPDDKTAARFEALAAEEKLLCGRIRSAGLTKGVTRDGRSISICANVGGGEDMELLENTAYDGIGLFRTEFVFGAFNRYPSFEEQREAYTAVVAAAQGRPVIIRTLDIGGDKALPYLELPEEENPFLGYRAVRVCLDREDIFLEQMMAILAAGAAGSVRIMFPMITEMRELTACKSLLQKAKSNLAEKGIAFDADIPVGMMVETPASAVMAERFAAACDFLSIGTNDLIQYVTCTDRVNPSVQSLYNPYNPAVIRLIAHTIRSCNKAGIEVSVCGELAGDLTFLLLLVGLGIDKLSVAPSLVEKVRYMVCGAERKALALLAEKVLELDDPAQIEALLDEARKKILGAL